MLAYPTFDDVLEAIPIVTPILRGGKIDTADGVRAGWIVAGYGLSVVLPSGAEAIVAPLTPFDANFVAGELDKLVEQAKTPYGAQAAASALPWVVIIKILLKLLLESLDATGNVPPAAAPA